MLPTSAVKRARARRRYIKQFKLIVKMLGGSCNLCGSKDKLTIMTISEEDISAMHYETHFLLCAKCHKESRFHFEEREPEASSEEEEPETSDETPPGYPLTDLPPGNPFAVPKPSNE